MEIITKKYENIRREFFPSSPISRWKIWAGNAGKYVTENPRKLLAASVGLGHRHVKSNVMFTSTAWVIGQDGSSTAGSSTGGFSSAGPRHCLQQQASRSRVYVAGSSTAGPRHCLQQRASRSRVYEEGSSTAGSRHCLQQLTSRWRVNVAGSSAAGTGDGLELLTSREHEQARTYRVILVSLFLVSSHAGMQIKPVQILENFKQKEILKGLHFIFFV